MIHDQGDNESDEAAALAPGSGPLPPIPDGGLAGAMPGWLREAPPSATVATTELPRTPDTTPDTAGLDPAGFITEDDLPDWLRQLSTTDRPPPAATSAFRGSPPSPPQSSTATTGSTARPPATGTDVPNPDPSLTALEPAAGSRLDPAPAPIPATKPVPLPRHDHGPIRPVATTDGSPQAPIPEESPASSNRGVIITGIVLVLIAAGIVVYLFASGTL